MKKTVKIAVTGAAGQIGYSLLFRLASGEVFGPEVKVELNLIELPEALKAAEGTALELDDCAFSQLNSVNCFDNPEDGFDGVHWALLVGSRPRGPGMERGDLIKANGPIFVRQGKALARGDQSLRVVVVGNPCNTNALIALHNCRDVAPDRFSAMTALDENRGKAQLAQKAGVPVETISNLTIWGNHSPTMFPDFENAKIDGKPVTSVVSDRNWLETAFMTTVQKRGAEIIASRGKSSAASAASACIDHIRCFTQETPAGQWFSAAVPTDGELYQIPKGLIFSLPVRFSGGKYEVVNDLPVSDYAKDKLKTTTQELLNEREVIKDLLVP